MNDDVMCLNFKGSFDFFKYVFLTGSLGSNDNDDLRKGTLNGVFFWFTSYFISDWEIWSFESGLGEFILEGLNKSLLDAAITLLLRLPIQRHPHSLKNVYVNFP